MLIKRPRGWEMPESAVTSEHLVLNRRAVMAGAAGLSAALALPGIARAQGADPSASLYPAARNPKYADASLPVTPESASTIWNNFYEYGTSKNVASAAQQLRVRPWEISIEGMVEKPFTIGVDDLLKKVSLQERVYRFRCVEAWSMVVPWTGFPLAELVKLAKPLSGAKYIRFETFKDTSMAPGQRQPWYPWPYFEGLAMDEAMNDLPLIVTGAYGKPLPKQMGAPIRLITPWKYGFKSIKSITKVAFVAERPRTFWEDLGPSEYGFWANVNPAVPHPRWSQASEEVLGKSSRQPTLLFNGYAEQVAELYKDKAGERLYM